MHKMPDRETDHRMDKRYINTATLEHTQHTHRVKSTSTLIQPPFTLHTNTQRCSEETASSRKGGEEEMS